MSRLRTVVVTLGALLAAAVPAGAHAATLEVSTTAARTDSSPLAGATLSGTRYVHLTGVGHGPPVSFWLDGVQRQVENNPPWDFAGGGVATAHPWDTRGVQDGAHTIEARWAGGAVEATFTVARTVPAPALVVSSSATRADAVPLQDATLSGTRYVFVTGVPAGAAVRFSLDGAAVGGERPAPHDLAGTAADGTAEPWDTATASDGRHRLDASILDGAGRTTDGPSAEFTVENAPASTSDPTHTLTISGDAFELDGRPFDMWGARVASATQSDAQTDHLVAQLPEYAAHGVNSVAVFYQGSRVAYSNPWNSDGTYLDGAHRYRMEQIIRRADQLGMVVIVGLFYQHAPYFQTAQAYRNATRTATAALKPFDNVIINIANEHNSGGWDDQVHVLDIRQPSNLLSLMSEARAVDPTRIIGGGGYDRGRNITIGKDSRADVLLFDTGNHVAQLPEYQAFKAAGVTKPMVNVEQFGGWTNHFPRGVFSGTAETDHLRWSYLQEIDSAAAHSDLYTFFHNGPWMQIPGPWTPPLRYDLAGQGVPGDIGVRWYWEAVRARRGL
jgi:hypothetical protein